MNLDLNFVEKYAPSNEEPYALNVSVRFPNIIDSDKLRADIVKMASNSANMVWEKKILNAVNECVEALGGVVIDYYYPKPIYIA